MRTSVNLDIHFILGEGVQSKVLEDDTKWEPGGDFEQHLYYQCEGKVGDYSTVDESFFCYLKTQQIPKHWDRFPVCSKYYRLALNLPMFMCAVVF